MKLITQNSTNTVVTFELVATSDYISAVTGATVSVQASKNGGAFYNLSGISEVGNGVYKLTLAGTDTDLLGDLWIVATAPGAVRTSVKMQVVAFNPNNSQTLGVGNLDVAVSTRSTYAGSDTAGTTTMLSRLTSTRATNLDNLDTPVSSRLPTSSYVIPPTTTEISSSVWAATTRTLTGFGSLVVDVVAGVWGATTRTLTSSFPAVPTTNEIATAVWGYSSRVLTAFGFNVTVGTNNDKSGYAINSNSDKTGYSLSTSFPAVPTANENADALLDRVNGVETNITTRQALRLLIAVMSGKSSETNGVFVVKRRDGTTTAITITHDDLGNRTDSQIGTL